MKIVKKGTFDKKGIPTGWHLDLDDCKEGECCVGLDRLFPGSVDVNGIEMVEWEMERASKFVTGREFEPEIKGT